MVYAMQEKLGSSNDKAYSCNVDFEGSVIVTGEFESYTLWLDDSVSLSVWHL
jgi:hypothetical protein